MRLTPMPEQSTLCVVNERMVRRSFDKKVLSSEEDRQKREQSTSQDEGLTRKRFSFILNHREVGGGVANCSNHLHLSCRQDEHESTHWLF